MVASGHGAAHAAGGRSGPAFWTGAIVGGALVAFGLRGLLVFEPRGAASALRWLVGSAVVLDLLVVPILAGVGWLLHRWLPGWAWRVVRAGLLVSAALVVFALPLVLGWGEAPGNPTVRPRDEREGLLVALGWTWLAVAAALGIGAWRRRGPGRPTAPPAPAGSPNTAELG